MHSYVAPFGRQARAGLTLALCAILAPALHAQTPTADTAPSAELALPAAVPKNTAEIEPARQLVERAIADITPATQPATTQPSDEEKARTAGELLKVLSDYVDALRQLEGEWSAGEKIGSRREQERRSRQLAGAQERDQQVQAELDKTATLASATEVETAEAEYEGRNAEFEALTTQQTTRERRLADFDAELHRAQEASNAASAESAQARQAASTQPAAESGAAAAGATLALKALEWRTALMQLREEVLKAEQVRLIQEQKLDAAYLPVLSSLVEHLGKWAGALRGIADASRQEEIQRRLNESSDPVERLFWEGAKLAVSTMKDFNDANKTLRERFPRVRSEELARQITRERAAWGRAIEGLDRAGGQTRLQWYNDVLETIARARRRRDIELRPALDVTFTERDRLLSLRDEYQADVQHLSTRFEEIQAAAVGKIELQRAADVLKSEVEAHLAGTPKIDAVRTALDELRSAVADLLPEGGATRLELMQRLDGLTRALGIPLAGGGESTGAARAKDGLKTAILGAPAARSTPQDVRGDLRELLSVVKALPERWMVSRAKQRESELIRDYYPRTQAAIGRALSNAEDLIARLHEAVNERTHYLEALMIWRDTLYWSTLLARDNGWFTADFAAIGAELRALRPPGPPPLQDLQLKFATQFSKTPLFYWPLLASLLVVSTLGGFLLRRRFLLWRTRREDRELEQMAAEERSELPVRSRLAVQVLGLLAAVSAWALPLGALTLAVRFRAGLTGGPQWLVVGCLLYISACLLAFNVWRRLFEPGKARFRLIGCSNVVATHYRRWGEAIIVVSAMLLGVFIACEAVEVLPFTRAYVLEIHKGVALILFLLFAWRRDLVLKVLGRTEVARHPQAYGVFVTIYPALWLGFVALLTLQVLGYGALTRYVIVNGLQTIVVAAVALLLTRLVHEESERLAERVRSLGLPQGAAAAAAQSASAGSDEEVERLLGGAAAREWSLFFAVSGRLFRWAIGTGALIWIAAAWGLTKRQAGDFMRLSLWGDAAGSNAVTIGRVLLGGGVVLATLWLSRIARRALQSRVYPYHSSIDRGAQVTINTLLHYTLVVLGFYFALRAVRVDFGALLVVLGGLGIGLGLGLQPLIVNFISGLLMLFERHVRVGDSVVIDGQLGEVTNVSMRSTTVRTSDGVHLVVPNGEFINKTVVNWTRGMIRGQVDLRLEPGADPAKVKEVLLSIGRRAAKVLSEPEPVVILNDLSEQSPSFTLICWFANPNDRAQSLAEMRFEVADSLPAHGINIAYPLQRTIAFDPNTPVTVRMVDGPDERPPAREPVRSAPTPVVRPPTVVERPHDEKRSPRRPDAAEPPRDAGATERLGSPPK